MENPQGFVKQFKDMHSFREWARTHIINECKEFIVIFEGEDMYDYCAELQFVIDEKVDKILTGFGFTD